jgi:hypothetical protein
MGGYPGFDCKNRQGCLVMIYTEDIALKTDVPIDSLTVRDCYLTRGRYSINKRLPPLPRNSTTALTNGC